MSVRSLIEDRPRRRTFFSHSPDEFDFGRRRMSQLANQVNSNAECEAGSTATSNEHYFRESSKVRHSAIRPVNRSFEGFPRILQSVVVKITGEAIVRRNDELQRVRGDNSERMCLCCPNGRDPQESMSSSNSAR